jgi:hypothetical protein
MARPWARLLWAAPPYRWVAVLMAAGAVLVGWSAWIHLHLWQLGYRNVHVIGPLFLSQAFAGFVLAAAVLATRRWPLAAAGALYMVGTAGGLLTSDWFGLFGFHDHLDAPYAGMSLAVEGTGFTVLVVSVVAAARAGARRAG